MRLKRVRVHWILFIFQNRSRLVELKFTRTFTLSKLQWPRCHWEFQCRGTGHSVKFNWFPVNFHWFPVKFHWFLVEFHWISTGIPLDFPVTPVTDNQWRFTGSCYECSEMSVVFTIRSDLWSESVQNLNSQSGPERNQSLIIQSIQVPNTLLLPTIENSVNPDRYILLILPSP